MDTEEIRREIEPYVVNGELTWDNFDKVFDFLLKKDQYTVADIIQDDLKIALVDELSADFLPPAVKDANEITASNKELIKLIQEGDEQAQQDLCIKNSKLVAKFALKYWRKFPDKLELDDLIQEGNIGLITAAERFKFDKETEFSTYAVFWIEQKIMRAISNTGLAVRLPVQLVQKILKATRIDKELQTTVLDVRKRLELIAQKMEMNSEDIRRLFKLRDVYFRLISLDVNVGEDMDTPLANFIPDEKAKLEDNVSLVLLREQIEDVLETLSKREREVLILRYGLEDGTTRTLEEVGKIFKVTRERIRQIENTALRKLRHPSRSKKLKDFLDF
ncbi:MAG: sigma-70 family RNA polymerase sigma factor [Selenomonadaceae bacterium]|nr:sigma-70 family RNA polymerase sigma factor [Selenomonadaceae bacterium]